MSQSPLEAKLISLHRYLHGSSYYRLIVLVWALPLIAGFAAYENRMTGASGEHLVSTKLAMLLLVLYFCVCVSLASVYWFLDRWGKMPALRDCLIDAVVISAPLAFATSSIVQGSFSVYTDAIIIAGTFSAMGIVVMINVFRRSIR